jgi:glycylpeptide N-tetradecanoyltransferase
LRWALTPPGYRPEWLVGIRDQNKSLVASITGVPVTVLVEDDKLKMAEINFLCVHKTHRVNKLAALLIS